MCNLPLLLHSFLLIFLCQSTLAYSWGWFSSPSTESHLNNKPIETSSTSNNFLAEFSMESFSGRTGKQALQNAKDKLAGPDLCWQNAYKNLFAACSEIIADTEKKSRLAWHLTDCFQKDSGRPDFPSCDTSNTPMKKCLEKLHDNAHKVYLSFYIETNSICHQLQANAFKRETERLVNDLKDTAQLAWNTLEDIEYRSEQLIVNSNQIQSKISSIDLQIGQVAQTSQDVEKQIDVVLNYSNDIFKQSEKIAASQSELEDGQTQMRNKFEEGVTMLEESYGKLGEDVERLRSETIDIQKEISEVSTSMSLKMNNLQDKADDIGNITGLSLDKQKLLLDGQSTALEGLDFLTKFQSDALEESRRMLHGLADFGRKQQEELLQQQQELQRAHDLLAANSRSILEAQEAFELKQANMFEALDKLFTLHNAILRESRSIKAFIHHAFITFMVYLFTSAKQTYNVRAKLYLGLCLFFLLEFAIVRFGCDDQTWIDAKVTMVRSTFTVLACIQILLSIITYRDYDVLNYNMLRDLRDRVNIMEKHKYLAEEEESSVNLSSWIDTELPEDESINGDPDYIIHEVEDNSIATSSLSRRYDLRSRLR